MTDRPRIADLIPPPALELVHATGKDLLKELGARETRKLVIDVLVGENARRTTEPLTHRRVAALNAALTMTLARAQRHYDVPGVLDAVHHEIQALEKKSAAEYKMLSWILGLTTKQEQNVLRDSTAWGAHVERYKDSIASASTLAGGEYGDASLEITVGELDGTHFDWTWALLLLNAACTQERATRGSEKSLYGKLLEKLVFSSALHLLGFTHDPDMSGIAETYWLNETDQREADATVLIRSDLGVWFDMGFIGRGNSEQVAAKFKRFGPTRIINGRKISMRTVIISEALGKRSKFHDLAKKHRAIVVQMSDPDWIATLDAKLKDIGKTDYKRAFVHVETSDLHERIREALDEEFYDDLLTQLTA